VTITGKPRVSDLWEQARREHPLTDKDRANGVTLSPAQSDRFRQLMREHGHLVPGAPSALPCGWSPPHRQPPDPA
jgi:hypothetical protein